MTRRNFSLTCIMREDLLKAYREVYTSCRSQKEAYLKTVKHAAPRFYVTPKQAYDRLRLMVHGDFTEVDKLSLIRRKMYYDLFEKLNVTSQRTEYIGKSLWFICPFLVTQPADEFYLSVESFKDIFPTLKKYGKEYHHRDVREQNKGKRPKPAR